MSTDPSVPAVGGPSHDLAQARRPNGAEIEAILEALQEIPVRTRDMPAIRRAVELIDTLAQARRQALEEAEKWLQTALWKYINRWESGWPGEMPMHGFDVVRIVQREMKELLAAFPREAGPTSQRDSDG